MLTGETLGGTGRRQTLDEPNDPVQCLLQFGVRDGVAEPYPAVVGEGAAEIGTHLELCQRGGYYASLVERQLQGFLGESEPSRAA